MASVRSRSVVLLSLGLVLLMTPTATLRTFLEERLREMRKEPAHAEQLDRITRTQRKFLREGNLALPPPLRWTVNRTRFHIDSLAESPA